MSESIKERMGDLTLLAWTIEGVFTLWYALLLYLSLLITVWRIDEYEANMFFVALLMKMGIVTFLLVAILLLLTPIFKVLIARNPAHGSQSSSEFFSSDQLVLHFFDNLKRLITLTYFLIMTQVIATTFESDATMATLAFGYLGFLVLSSVVNILLLDFEKLRRDAKPSDFLAILSLIGAITWSALIVIDSWKEAENITEALALTMDQEPEIVIFMLLVATHSGFLIIIRYRRIAGAVRSLKGRILAFIHKRWQESEATK